MTDQSIGDAVWLEILHRAVNDQTYFETKVSVAWRDDVNQVASKNEQENERTRSDSQNLDACALLLILCIIRENTISQPNYLGVISYKSSMCKLQSGFVQIPLSS